MTALNPLRPAQSLAARPHDNAWVSASAGTGKTQVLTARVLRLLLADAAPERILCLTFTKAAAAEMQTRIYARLAAWVRASDADLDTDLSALGLQPNPNLRDDARRLFARTLDARGGLRIVTIHSFAQSLLASFPVEAGVAPGFQALDDRTGAELRARALADTLETARDAGDDGFAADVAELAIRLGEAGMAGLAGRLIRHREAIGSLGNAHGFEPALRRALGLPTDCDPAQAIADACLAVDAAALAAFARAMRDWGAKTGLDHADVIAAWLARDGAARAETLPLLHAVFVKQDGDPRKLPAKPLAADPGLADVADAIVAALSAIARLRDGLELARAAALALRVGHALAVAYDAHKARGGTLDFDDMIARAASLLTQDGVADWVRFKLDSQIDHILVDEAQDTNEHQWTIVRVLAEEFFAGLGQRGDAPRTMFAVGDFKQSIFGFQGSDPEWFETSRQHFRSLATDANAEFHDVDLAESFRSGPAVLAVVDQVLAALGHASLGLPDPVPPHVPARGNVAGRVTLWPALVDPSHGGEDAAPSEQGWMLSSEVRMAQALAAQIAAWLNPAHPLMLEAKGRAVRPEDILVLVRARGDFVAALVANLHAHRVPVAGVDRLRLTEPLAVQDLLALVRFALQPDDDLTLGTLLVSPFVGLDQDALFGLAHDRDGSLWRALRAAAARGDARARDAVDWLRGVLALADLVAPYEFFETLLSGPLRGRARLLARLGEEARDSIDEMLNQALAFEASHAPSLQGFLAWIERDDVELKRDPEAPLDAVRIMTVHGAKGLQAPVVILADAARDPADGGDGQVMLPLDGGAPVPVVYGTRQYRIGPVAREADAADARAREEHWRLLYVALTRAEDLLFVGGSLGKRAAAPGPDSWHAVIRSALETIGADTRDDPHWAGEALSYSAGTPAPAKIANELASTGTPTKLPGWAATAPVAEARPPRPLSPSAIAEDDVASPPATSAETPAARRGSLLHALFERLPAVAPSRRPAAADAWLTRHAPERTDRAEIAATALGIVDHPDFAAIFGPDSLAEAPIAAVVGATVIAGQVDRLLVEPDRVAIVDFKTGLHVPATAADVPPYHLKQMAAYAAALARVFPDRRVEAALLYTEAARLIPLPPDLLAAHAPPG